MVVWGLARDRERGGREGFQRGKRELFGVMESSYLDSGPSFTDMCVYGWEGGGGKNLSNCTLQICTVYSVYYTSIENLEVGGRI